MVNHNVASLTGGFWSHNSLGRDDLTSEWCFVLVHIDWNSRLIPIRISLQKVLLFALEENGANGACRYNTGTDTKELFGVVDGFNNLNDFLRSARSRWGTNRGERNSRKKSSGPP